MHATSFVKENKTINVSREILFLYRNSLGPVQRFGYEPEIYKKNNFHFHNLHSHLGQLLIKKMPVVDENVANYCLAMYIIRRKFVMSISTQQKTRGLEI